MKKETIITAIVFFGAGYLAGYIYQAQRSSNARVEAVSAARSRSEDSEPGGALSSRSGSGPAIPGLPEGHPPVDTAAMIKMFEDQAAENPRDPEPRLRLANLLFDQHEFEGAVEWYQKALELDPKNVSARTDLGTCLYNLGRSRDAVREYRRSLAINPAHEPTLYNLILVNLEGTHDLEAARAAWARLQKLNPNHPGLDRLKQRLDVRPAAPASR